MLIYSKSFGVTYPALCHTLMLWIVKEKYVFVCCDELKTVSAARLD